MNSSTRDAKLDAAKTKLRKYQNNKQKDKSSLPSHHYDCASASSEASSCNNEILFNEDDKLQTAPTEFNYNEKRNIRSLLDRMNDLLVNTATIEITSPISSSLPLASKNILSFDNTQVKQSFVASNDLDSLKDIQFEAQLAIEKEKNRNLENENQHIRNEIAQLNEKLCSNKALIDQLYLEKEELLLNQQNYLKHFQIQEIEKENFQKEIFNMKSEMFEMRERLKKSQNDYLLLKNDHDLLQHKYNMVEIRNSQLSFLQQEIQEFKENTSETVEYKTCENCQVVTQTMEMEREKHFNLEAEWLKQSDRLQRELTALNKSLNDVMLERDSLRKQIMLADIENKEIKIIKDEGTQKNTVCDPKSVLEEIQEWNDQETIQKTTTSDDKSCQSCSEWSLRVERLEYLLWLSQNECELLKNNFSEKTESVNHLKSVVDASRGDKAALSRAISQNKQLKERLEELETKFIAMSEESMRILTELEHERYVRQKNISTVFTSHEMPPVQPKEEDTTMIMNTDNNCQFKATTPLDSDEASQSQETFQFEHDLKAKYETLLERNHLLELKTQKLENAVAQLDCETHTINEYVLLYRNQRLRLHQKACWWEQYAQQMLHEKYTLLERIEKLETFIRDYRFNRNETHEEEGERNVDADEEIEAIIFSKDAPLGGQVVDFSQTNHLFSQFQDKIIIFLEDLKKEIELFSSNHYFKLSSPSETYDVIPSLDVEQSTVESQTIPAFYRTDIPSCKCCSGSLLVL